MRRQLILECQVVACITMMLLITSLSAAAEESGGGNASNPLVKGKNTYLRYYHLDLGGGLISDKLNGG